MMAGTLLIRGLFRAMGRNNYDNTPLKPHTHTALQSLRSVQINGTDKPASHASIDHQLNTVSQVIITHMGLDGG